MRIADVEVFAVACELKAPLQWGNFLINRKGGVLVSVITDEGITGIGEAGFSVDFYPILKPIIENMLVPAIHGEDPTNIEKIWEKMYLTTHKWGRRGQETYALSGVDIALWDILGKSCGQPLYRLLGGYRNRVPAYAAPSLKPAQAVAKDCQAAVERGFRSIKLRVGFDPETDREIVCTARRIVGDKIGLGVDANMAYDYRTALRMAEILAGEYGILWFEEPIRSRSLYEYVNLHAELNRTADVPVSGGECLFTRYEFVPVFENKAFDIVQPDATGVGGITESRKISSMASSHGVSFMPHIACSSGTGIGLAANAHLLCASDSAPMIEYDQYDNSPLQTQLLKEPIRAVDGYVTVPDKPGLGVEIDPAALDRYRI